MRCVVCANADPADGWTVCGRCADPRTPVFDALYRETWPIDIKVEVPAAMARALGVHARLTGVPWQLLIQDVVADTLDHPHPTEDK